MCCHAMEPFKVALRKGRAALTVTEQSCAVSIIADLIEGRQYLLAAQNGTRSTACIPAHCDEDQRVVHVSSCHGCIQAGRLHARADGRLPPPCRSSVNMMFTHVLYLFRHVLYLLHAIWGRVLPSWVHAAHSTLPSLQ